MSRRVPSNESLSRRAMIGTVMSGVLASPANLFAAPRALEAIAFDAFPIFDPRSISAVARSIFPEKGEMLATVWSARLFAYTWIETAAGGYVDFATLAAASLTFAAESVGLSLDERKRELLLSAYEHLDLWPDVKPVLGRLRAKGIRMALLSNLSEANLRSNMIRTGIADYFDPPLSTDKVRRFKPAPIAYQMAVDAFALPKESIGFVAFGSWDAFGATSFGYRTAWINRLRLPAERLGFDPAFTTTGLDGALTLVGVSSSETR